MLRTLGIVDACYDSHQARSQASRKLGGKSVLEWVVRRATDCQQLDGVIVVTNNAVENEFLARLVPLDVPIFTGKHDDPLSCMAAALEEYRCESAVRISSVWPFLDSTLVDQLVVTATSDPQCDYASYSSRDGRPAILSPVGVYVEWLRSQTLREVAKRATSRIDRYDPTRYVYLHPQKFRVLLIPAPERIDRDDVRLTVDIEEDWEHTLTIFEALGPDLDWRRIADLLDHQPALRKRMADLNRVHARV